MDESTRIAESDIHSELPFKTTPEGLGHEKMMEEASVIAHFLSSVGGVDKVGIAGSLSKGKENPTDIDFVLFIDNEKAKACFLEATELRKKGSTYKVDLSKYLTMTDDNWNMFIDLLHYTDSAVDFIVLSSNPDEEYAKLMADNNIDPNFLDNISNDVQIYDPKSDSFSKQNVYDETQKEFIKKTAFTRLKEIVTQPDPVFLESVFHSKSHQKRIAKLKL